MKILLTAFIGLFLSVGLYSQTAVTVTEIYMPQYIQGAATLAKVPYVCRVKISDLTAGAVYRYYNLLTNDPNALATTNGSGVFVRVNQTGNFTRITAPSVGTASTCGEFTADANGTYTGWFMVEVTNAVMFRPGLSVYFRILLNDGAGGIDIAKKGVGSTAIKIITWGPSTTADRGTAVRSTAATSATAKNFVMLWDNVAGTGQPIAGTVIEGDGTANTTANGFAVFYAARVNEQAKTWGTIIPNNLPNGIKKIVQYSLADASKVGSKTSANGLWAKEGGGTVNTINSSGIDTLVLDGAAVPLGPPVNQSITFNGPLSKTYGDAPFDPGATASSGLPVLYSSNNTAVADTVRINGTLQVVIKGVGMADLTASQGGDDDNLPASNAIQSLLVNKKDLLIKPQKQFWVKGSPMPDLTLTYTGFVNGDDSSVLNPRPQVSTTATAGSPEGDYEISVSGAGALNYNISYDTATLSIVSNMQPQTITFNPLSNKVYGSADYNPGAIVNSPLTVTYTSLDPAVATIVNNKIHIVGVGTARIIASQPGDQITYKPATDVSQTLTVVKAPLAIIAEDKTKLLNQPVPTLTIVYVGFVNGDTNTSLITQPTITTPANDLSPAGKYPITVTGAVSNNYDITYDNGELTISSLLGQTINFPVLPAKKYGDTDFKAGAKANSGLAVIYKSSNANVATIVKDSMIHIVGAGTTIITASQPGNTSYAAATDVPQTLNVQKASLTIRATDQTKNEGESNPDFTLTYAGFVNGDDSSKLATLPTVSTIATATSLAGTYRIIVQGATSPNYTINQQNGTLTVLPAQGNGQDNAYVYNSGPGQLQVNVFAVNPVKVAIQLFDLNGSRLINTAVTLSKGFNTYRIPVGNLAPGVYNVRVVGGELLLKSKVVIH